jgi:hypothetical protein
VGSKTEIKRGRRKFHLVIQEGIGEKRHIYIPTKEILMIWYQ